MNIKKIKKESRTFMPEINNPGTGLSPLTDKSRIPFNNVKTIQDVMDGNSYKMPDAGGNWGRGEDLYHSYKDQGDDYKRKERDDEIINRLMNLDVLPQEKWRVKIPGGIKEFNSFSEFQKFKEKMRTKNIPIKWVTKVASKNRVEIISESLTKTFKLESTDIYNETKEVGSCFCISSEYFLTCAHVIMKYNRNVDNSINIEDYKDKFDVNIIHNGKKYNAEIIDIDFTMDIALLKSEIDVPPFSLDVLSMQVGNEILTIGSPFGFDNNVSFGNISSIGKKIYNEKNTPNYFFIDAPVFKGNSGGPIIKVETGDVLGILTSVIAKNGDYGLNIGLPSYYLQQFCIKNNIYI